MAARRRSAGQVEVDVGRMAGWLSQRAGSFLEEHTAWWLEYVAHPLCPYWLVLVVTRDQASAVVWRMNVMSNFELLLILDACKHQHTK